jgi:hypothetical protein
MRTGDLKTLLAELEDRLQTFGAPIADAFRPGLPETEIRAALAADGLPAPSELVTWWGWHNGSDVSPPTDGVGVLELPESRLLDIFHLLSLEASLGTRRWFRDLYDNQLGYPQGYPLGWTPLLQAGRAAIEYCGDALADEDRVPLYVYYSSTPDESPPVQFDSLAELVALMVGLFDQREVVPDADDPRLPSLRETALSDDARRLRGERH